jgi:hypothetical protein
MTIASAHEAGAAAARARFGFKEANLIDTGISAARNLGLVGMGPEAFVQGPAAFRAGGALHPRQVLWPTLPGQPVRQTLGRIGTLGTLAALPGMMHSDPEQGRAARLLGGIGGLAGMMYGGQAGGLAVAPIGMALGRGLGHAVGRLF